MFDKVKSLNNLRKSQAELMKALKSVYAEVEEKGVKVLVRGDLHFEKISLNGEERKDIRDAINEAIKELNKKSEKLKKSSLADLGVDLP